MKMLLTMNQNGTSLRKNLDPPLLIYNLIHYLSCWSSLLVKKTSHTDTLLQFLKWSQFFLDFALSSVY